jgi:predicted nucleic acid-binding protein
VRTAVDTNVISALWSGEPAASRVAAQLEQAHARGGWSSRRPSMLSCWRIPTVAPKFVDNFLADTGVAVDFDLDERVWRQTASGFAAYEHRRRRSHCGSPKRLLVDFIVAAHALLQADRLMTLDAGRYKQDFPKLRVV